MSAVAFLVCILCLVYVYAKQIVKHKETVDSYKRQVESYKKLVPDYGSIIPMSHFREVVGEKETTIHHLREDYSKVEKELSELKSQQQSKSVRLGLISENVLPFHAEFKYNVKDLVPMFRPIDYVVFAEDEIVFLEIKIGTSQLSEKQRRIKGLIDAGKVRFEEHRVTEKGYTIKESNGKESQTEFGSRV
jgi:predicted Holliday junction resolvase-like endonuclease